jgi:hypothetical protein
MTEYRIIERLWAKQPGQYVCLSTKDRDGRWRDHMFSTVDIGTFVTENIRRNIYFAPMKFTAPLRRKEYTVLPRLLWADLDEADPRKVRYRPTVAIESSPRRYVGLWCTDKVVSEVLNRRMTYAVGGDKGGWDLVQVLRLPGTINFKYAARPRVRLLWDDGPTYSIAELERRLPRIAVRIRASKGRRTCSMLGMETLIDKHSIDGWLRRALLGPGRPTTLPNQSGYKFHYKMACALHERGVPRAEAFVLLSTTAWNKHSSDQPVWNMIDKIWRD